jgi:hypothetical protein
MIMTTDIVTRKRSPGFYTNTANKRFKSNIIGTVIFSFDMKKLAELEPRGKEFSEFRDSTGKIWTGFILRMNDDGVFIHVEFGRKTADCKLRRITAHCKDWTQQVFQDGFVEMGKYKEFAQRFIDEDDKELVVSIDIEEYDEPECPVQFEFIPALSKILESTETADVTFKVDDAEFFLHKCVLAVHCPKLYEFAMLSKGEPVVIDKRKIDKRCFESIVDYIYAYDAIDFFDEGVAKRILNAANYLGYTKLKLHAEWGLINHHLEINNAIEYLLLAESQSCAYLKEGAMQFCLSYLEDIKKTPGWVSLKESPDLLVDLLSYSCKPMSPAANGTTIIEDIDVPTLCKELQRRDLEIDGTREMLIQRLKDATVMITTTRG